MLLYMPKKANKLLRCVEIHQSHICVCVYVHKGTAIIFLKTEIQYKCQMLMWGIIGRILVLCLRLINK